MVARPSARQPRGNGGGDGLSKAHYASVKSSSSTALTPPPARNHAQNQRSAIQIKGCVGPRLARRGMGQPNHPSSQCPLRGKTHTPSRTPAGQGARRECSTPTTDTVRAAFGMGGAVEGGRKGGAVWRRGDHPGHVEHFTSSSDGQHSNACEVGRASPLIIEVTFGARSAT